jgi:CHAT domain
MEYLDFELSVDARGGGEYEVSVRAPSGEARARVRFPFTSDDLVVQLRAVQGALEHARGMRDIVSAETNGGSDAPREVVERFGRTLFATLLSGKVLVAWRASGALAEKDGHGLRLQLRLQAPEMAALPWELMFDPDDASFVCLNPSTPLVRYPELDRAPELLTVTLPLRVLGMIASPSNLPQLDKHAERSRIERALKQLQRDGLVELNWIEGGTYRDLQAAMRQGPWHVFHFIGHGGFEGDGASGEGVLALETTPSMAMPMARTGEVPVGFAGPAHLVPADLVGQLLRGHPSLRLVLLNSCLGARASSGDVFSSTASTLVRRGIPAVIAMQHEITDRAAVVFAQAFYTSLAAGTAVDRAVTDARTAISAVNRESIEWGTPVLLMRSPNGMLFAPAAAPPNGAATTGRAAVPAVEPRGRMRASPAVLAAVVGLPLAAAALLGWIRAPGAELALDAQVSGIGVTFPAARALAEPIEVASLGVSGLVVVDLPRSDGGGAIATDRVLLTALDEPGRPGRLTLDLTPVLPAGTHVAVATADEPGTYQLSLSDSIPDLTVAAVGPVKVVVPGTMNERMDFTVPGMIRLGAERGTVGLEFRPAAGARTALADKLPADGLDLTRVDRFESAAGTELREVSTIRKGQLAVGGGSARPIATGEELRAAGVHGEVARLELAGDHLELAVRGRADRLTAGSGAMRRNLVPSLLAWLLANHILWLAGAAALYLGATALVLTGRWRRTG